MSVSPLTTPDAPVDWAGRFRERLAGAGRREFALWMVAAAVMLLDVGLTDYGLAMGLSEVNPLGRMALAAFGSVGLLLAKLPVFALALVGWWLLPATERWVVPIGLSVPWGIAVVLNLYVLLSAV